MSWVQTPYLLKNIFFVFTKCLAWASCVIFTPNYFCSWSVFGWSWCTTCGEGRYFSCAYLLFADELTTGQFLLYSGPTWSQWAPEISSIGIYFGTLLRRRAHSKNNSVHAGCFNRYLSTYSKQWTNFLKMTNLLYSNARIGKVQIARKIKYWVLFSLNISQEVL